MTELQAPYWMAKDGLPGLDFNRHLAEPGSNPEFPDGALAIYVDDDFWCVAALPLERYRDVPVQDIVAELWPHYAEQATYAPDHGTIEQRLYFANTEIECLKTRAKGAEEELMEARAENARLKAGRTDMSPRRPTRLEAQNGYFIAQYEHLLVAMAHEAAPRPDMRGVCSTCGLYVSDRVHQEHWIERKKAGHRPELVWHGELGNDRSLGGDTPA